MSRTRSKKTPDRIDLSGPTPASINENGSSFIVNDYDYASIQNTSADPQFENDLKYLLNNNNNNNNIQAATIEAYNNDRVISDITNTPKNTRKPKVSKFSVDDITKDILDLDFSDGEDDEPKPAKVVRQRNKRSPGIRSDPEVNNPNGNEQNKETNSNRNETKNRQQKLNKQKSADFRKIRSDSLAFEKKLNKSKSMDFRSDKEESKLRKKASMNSVLKRTAITPEILDEIDTESEADVSILSIGEVDEAAEAAKEKRRLRNKRRKERRTKAKWSKEGSTAKETVDTAPSGELNLENAVDVVDVADPDATLDSIDNDTPEADFTPDTSKRSSDDEVSPVRKVTFTQEAEPQKKLSIEETLKLNRKKSMEILSQSNPTIDPSNPFDIKLRSTKKSTMNSKYSNKLPEIQPSKTIIGLSHKQIMNLDVSDVKLKTILSSSKISKYSSTSLNFTIKHSNDLFKDVEKKKIFFLLCVNVALYESIGFKKTVQLHPNILELFGGYTEINLETTRTKLTPSNKDIHQNNLDYSVLSYIGNILIWALHQQRQNNEPLIDSKYDLGVSVSLVRENVGGYHLWDRLIREPQGMNAKRWKHIIKFRQAFAYEEDQFVLILRFMGVDS